MVDTLVSVMALVQWEGQLGHNQTGLLWLRDQIPLEFLPHQVMLMLMVTTLVSVLNLVEWEGQLTK